MDLTTFTKFFKKNQPEEPPKTEQKEQAITYDDAFFSLGGKMVLEDPDELKRVKGAGIYTRMLKDPQVEAVFNLILNTALSRVYTFKHTEENQEEIEEYFKFVIDNLQGTWLQGLKNILFGKAYGYSVTEKIYKTTQFNGKTVWVLNALKAKPVETFEFEVDKFGNVKAIIQDVTGANPKRLDPNKFVHYVNKPEHDPVYGKSDLRSAYRAYWEKDGIIKLWNIYLERMAGGSIAFVPKTEGIGVGTANETLLHQMMDNFKTSNAFTVPTG